MQSKPARWTRYQISARLMESPQTRYQVALSSILPRFPVEFKSYATSGCCCNRSPEVLHSVATVAWTLDIGLKMQVPSLSVAYLLHSCCTNRQRGSVCRVWHPQGCLARTCGRFKRRGDLRLVALIKQHTRSMSSCTQGHFAQGFGSGKIAATSCKIAHLLSFALAHAAACWRGLKAELSPMRCKPPTPACALN